MHASVAYFETLRVIATSSRREWRETISIYVRCGDTAVLRVVLLKTKKSDTMMSDETTIHKANLEVCQHHHVHTKVCAWRLNLRLQ